MVEKIVSDMGRIKDFLWNHGETVTITATSVSVILMMGGLFMQSFPVLIIGYLTGLIIPSFVNFLT